LAQALGVIERRALQVVLLMSGWASGLFQLAELWSVWRWSSQVLRTRLVRVYIGDKTLPVGCNACGYLFQPSRLPQPFQAAQPHLPQLCNCTGPVGCKFPRGGPTNGRLEFARIPAE